MGDMADMLTDQMLANLAENDGRCCCDPQMCMCDEPELNMYFCTPCPKCKEMHRYPNKSGMVVCDDCGHKEKK